MKPNFDIKLGHEPDAQAYEQLRQRAFAFASVAPRAADVLRVGAVPLGGTVALSYIGDVLTGYVALWPVHLASANGAHDLVLLGPLMVDPAYQSCGLGSALMEAVLQVADSRNLPPIMLVGDDAYYRRFGFVQGLAQRWQMPGLAAPNRVLLRPKPGLQLPFEGSVLPAFAPPRQKQAAA